MAGPADEEYSGFPGMAFDIAATPNGSILVGTVDFGPLFFGPNTIQEIGRRGVTEVTSIPTPEGSPINGLEPIGQRNFYAAAGGGDRTVGAGVWRVSQGNERLVADISSFTLGSFDFGTGEGEPGPSPQWKDMRCEPFVGEFSPGPQTNPYHLAAKNGGELILADAANNGVLRVRASGEIEVVAFMDPPLDPDNGWMELGTFDLGTNAEGFPGEDFVEYDLGEGEITCFVEPVPTAVAIGDDGAYYVGELTGAAPVSVEGLARVWRIEPGTRDATCPSAECTVAIDGLTTVIGMAFGPDGYLYAVEFDYAGFLAAFGIPGIDPQLGKLKRCDVGEGTCEVVEDNLLFPGAITFDKGDNLWLLDNVFAPTVRRVDWR
jgi:hypothetical protein